jgi:hypothetical protein
MSITESEFKTDYLRLPADSTANVSVFLAAAQSKARTAGIPVFQNNAQYDLFVYSLAAMLYENRGATVQDPATSGYIQRFIDSTILELRYAEEDPAEDGGEA